MSLFSSSADSPAAPAARSFILQFDGGSRGNPGPAGCGITLNADDGTPLYELGVFLGRCTNNVAEYQGLIHGLKAALAMGAQRLTIRADSQLIVRQMNGQYKVRHPNIRPLYDEAIKLFRQIPEATIDHTYREGNTRADALANLAMDQRTRVEPLGPLPA